MQAPHQREHEWGLDVSSRDRQVLCAAAAGALSGAVAGAIAGWFDPVAIFWFFVPLLGAAVGATVAGVVALITAAVLRRSLSDAAQTRRWRWWAPPVVAACVLWSWLLLGTAFITSSQQWSGMALAAAGALAVTLSLADWVTTARR